MTRTFSTFVAMTAAAPVFADPGLHHHPHGITSGWVIVAAVLVVPAVAIALRRARK